VRVEKQKRTKASKSPTSLTANAIYHYSIAFPANNHTFKKGHRIMVQAQSTWFPVIDRNPQPFVPNIFLAKESDFKAAVQKYFVRSSMRHTSHCQSR
jgi:predicted acyl esterase